MPERGCAGDDFFLGEDLPAKKRLVIWPAVGIPQFILRSITGYVSPTHKSSSDNLVI